MADGRLAENLIAFVDRHVEMDQSGPTMNHKHSIEGETKTFLSMISTHRRSPLQTVAARLINFVLRRPR